MSIESTQSLPHGDILIVDDNTSNLKSMTDILAVTGYQVQTATDGESALRSVQTRQPELILLDYKMAGMNRIEVCRRIKSNSETEDISIIFLSAHGDIDLKVQALEAGGIDYVIKPVAPTEVLAKIEAENLGELSVLTRSIRYEKEYIHEDGECIPIDYYSLHRRAT